MRTKRGRGPAIDYERALRDLARLDKQLSPAAQWFLGRIRVKPHHDLDVLREVIASDPMNRRFPC